MKTEKECLEQAKHDLALLKKLLAENSYQDLAGGIKGLDAYNHSDEKGEIPFFDFNYLSLSGTIYQDPISNKPYLDSSIEVWLEGREGPQYYIDHETGEPEQEEVK